ncbi:GNAT family N-acetyltransferase [Paenibacillus sp. MMS20-IR301]|uniref:GNAT family N-acetyltransferase n=1 Tax=Paenibacillus sp. MMS20-IR301 TaxID=2895946 RepID=UPI0028EB51C6|nr:GNAT family N-acetyltransferase [Paenibacillus sp. MMS20-IR301]WNS44624.1 GNAT family N-acetyltransferase [Paenibacillus sp. MMS20-IR301]
MMLKLDSRNYAAASLALESVHINTLFAGAVLKGETSGEVYVDNLQQPRTFYVAHAYGMSLVFGDSGNADFNRSLCDYITNKAGERHSTEWLQADPAGDWTPLIDSIRSMHNSTLKQSANLPEAEDLRRIERNTRVNFTFNREAYVLAKEQWFRHDAEIVRMTAELFSNQDGGVIARFFWRDQEHFLTSGAGFTLLHEGKNASTAFSAYRTENQLEIGIESAAAHRGRHYAFSVCAALIDYCLEHGLEPVWGCRQENEPSYRLAQKLGFRVSLTLPYYRLAQ